MIAPIQSPGRKDRSTPIIILLSVLIVLLLVAIVVGVFAFQYLRAVSAAGLLPGASQSQTAEGPAMAALAPAPEAFSWVSLDPIYPTPIDGPALSAQNRILGSWDVCYFTCFDTYDSLFYMTAMIEPYDPREHPELEGANTVVIFYPQYITYSDSETVDIRTEDAPIVCGAYFNEGSLTVSFPDGTNRVFHFWQSGAYQRATATGFEQEKDYYTIAFTRTE